MKEVWSILRYELQKDFKQSYSFLGIILYLISSIFVCYWSFQTGLTAVTWNAIFWILNVFLSIQTVQKVWHEDRKEKIYLYLLVQPLHLFIGKLLYSLVLNNILVAINFLLCWSLLGEDIMQQAHIWAFLSVLALGISGITIAFNFVASIGAQQASASSLSAILGLPIVLPLLSATVQSAKLAIQGFDWLVINPNMINMLALSSLSLGLSLVLFPYIWQE